MSNTYECFYISKLFLLSYIIMDRNSLNQPTSIPDLTETQEHLN